MQQYYLIGSPISHSLSPAMHNLAFSILGIDARYGLCETDLSALSGTVERLKSENVSGWNVTMPDKQAMCDLCDILSPAARVSHSVNTVKNVEGTLYGYTTDGDGFIRAAKENGFQIESEDITLLGTGGAAVSILIACAFNKAAEIHIFYNRTSSADRIRTVIERLHTAIESDCEPKITLEPLSDEPVLRKRICNTGLLINATNVGMAGSGKESESLLPDLSWLSPDTDVFEAIYNPGKTVLLRQAEEAGCRYVNGLPMLLYQGAESFRIWTGSEMPVGRIQKEVFDHF